MSEYDQYRAVRPIFVNGSLAYNTGDYVPVSNVTSYGYVASGDVVTTGAYPQNPLYQSYLVDRGTFDTSQSYAVSDIFRFGGATYRPKTALTPGAFNPSNVEALAGAGVVSRLPAYDVTDSTQLAMFQTFSSQIAAKGGVNAFVGQAINDLPANTAAFPTGVTAYGKVVNSGNTAFGLFARADITNPGIVTSEINTFNFGATPSGTLPPNRSFGTTDTLPIVLTVASGGTAPSAIGIHLVQEGGQPQKMLAGLVIDPNAIRDYPMYVDGNAATYPSVVDGNGTYRAFPNVAAVFGVTPTDNSVGSQVMVGSINGNTPFIGASKTQAAFSDLAFVTGNAIRGYFLATGQFRLAQGNVIQIIRAGAGETVVTARKTGWQTSTGTATRTAFDTTSVTLPQLAERVKALIDDLHSTAGHGLIGT